MKKLFYKLVHADGVQRMRVYLKEGKRGFNVGVSVRTPNSGVKGTTGFQATFPHEVEGADEASLAEFNRLVELAHSEGWKDRGADPTGGRRTAFTTMPSGRIVETISAADVAEVNAADISAEESAEETDEAEEAPKVSGRSRRNR